MSAQSDGVSEDGVHKISALANRFVHAMQQSYAFTSSHVLQSTRPLGMATDSNDEANLFQQLDTYPWEADLEFQSGLVAILGSDPSSEHADLLTLRAQCFYYAR